LLVAGAALTAGADDNARRKGGGDGGSSRGGSSRGSSESAGARHTGGGSSGSGGEARSGGRVSNDEQPPRGRQRQQRRGVAPWVDRRRGASSGPGTGHGYGGAYYGYRAPYYGYGYGYPYYGYGYSYAPYWGWYGLPYYGYDPFFYGGYGYGGYGYGGGYFGAGLRGGDYAGYRYSDAGSIRTLVEPEKTKVFVDGYYAGEVDDFDGMFQRLYVSPGRHDVTFKLEGFRPHRVMVYVTHDNTIKIRHTMQKGAGDETVEDLSGGRTEPPYRMSDSGPDPRDRDRRYDERRDPRDSRDAGGLRLDVRPDDASVYVDGEFVGTARRAGILNLPPGRHRVEVVRPGHRTVERDVEIQPGRTETLAIDLERMD
jgi:hypothetical protein